MRLNKDIYIRNYEELQKRFSSLFWCIIHMPYSDYEKLTNEEKMSLKIRNNEFVFTEWSD